ncbi:MAG: YciI family protein [Oscillospiraceae bacterium]|nr:YciI family protein [Oscillospiraceae bacterium]
MQFVVIIHDGTDKEAPARRLATRPAHLEYVKPFFESGALVYGGALLDDAGNPVGSMLVANAPSAAALRSEILDGDPYMTEGVWQEVDIRPFRPAPFFDK